MVCIYCHHNTKVVNSRKQIADNSVWRRRKCTACQAVFTSIETINLEQALIVEKTNGQIEPFYKDKLFLSIYDSVDHLNDPIFIASNLTNTVLRHIQKNTHQVSITSQLISDVCASILKHYDAAAAIHYLSHRSNLKLANDVRRSLK